MAGVNDSPVHTQVADPEILAAWRTGPRWFHVVVAMIDDDAVERRRAEVAAALGELLHRTTPGQPHVTLLAVGFTEPELPPLPTISMQVHGAATFTSAAYLEVTGEQVGSCRQHLLAGVADAGRGEPYTPHVTVGTFRRVVPLQEVQRRLAPLAALPALQVTGHVRHAVVDTRSEVGALRG